MSDILADDSIPASAIDVCHKQWERKWSRIGLVKQHPCFYG